MINGNAPSHIEALGPAIGRVLLWGAAALFAPPQAQPFGAIPLVNGNAAQCLPLDELAGAHWTNKNGDTIFAPLPPPLRGATIVCDSSEAPIVAQASQQFYAHARTSYPLFVPQPQPAGAEMLGGTHQAEIAADNQSIRFFGPTSAQIPSLVPPPEISQRHPISVLRELDIERPEYALFWRSPALTHLELLAAQQWQGETQFDLTEPQPFFARQAFAEQVAPMPTRPTIWIGEQEDPTQQAPWRTQSSELFALPVFPAIDATFGLNDAHWIQESQSVRFVPFEPALHAAPAAHPIRPFNQIGPEDDLAQQQPWRSNTSEIFLPPEFEAVVSTFGLHEAHVLQGNQSVRFNQPPPGLFATAAAQPIHAVVQIAPQENGEQPQPAFARQRLTDPTPPRPITITAEQEDPSQVQPTFARPTLPTDPTPIKRALYAAGQDDETQPQPSFAHQKLTRDTPGLRPTVSIAEQTKGDVEQPAFARPSFATDTPALRAFRQAAGQDDPSQAQPIFARQKLTADTPGLRPAVFVAEQPERDGAQPIFARPTLPTDAPAIRPLVQVVEQADPSQTQPSFARQTLPTDAPPLRPSQQIAEQPEQGQPQPQFAHAAGALAEPQPKLNPGGFVYGKDDANAIEASQWVRFFSVAGSLIAPPPAPAPRPIVIAAEQEDPSQIAPWFVHQKLTIDTPAVLRPLVQTKPQEDPSQEQPWFVHQRVAIDTPPLRTAPLIIGQESGEQPQPWIAGRDPTDATPLRASRLIAGQEDPTQIQPTFSRQTLPTDAPRLKPLVQVIEQESGEQQQPVFAHPQFERTQDTPLRRALWLVDEESQFQPQPVFARVSFAPAETEPPALRPFMLAAEDFWIDPIQPRLFGQQPYSIEPPAPPPGQGGGVRKPPPIDRGPVVFPPTPPAPQYPFFPALRPFEISVFSYQTGQRTTLFVESRSSFSVIDEEQASAATAIEFDVIASFEVVSKQAPQDQAEAIVKTLPMRPEIAVPVRPKGQTARIIVASYSGRSESTATIEIKEKQ